MKNDVIDSLISANKFNNNLCSICKSEQLPIDINTSKNYEIKNLKSKLKLNEKDYSCIIKKCNCTKNSPRVHKLCILLNVVYGFSLKCPECNADYNIIVTKEINSKRKTLNLC